MKRMLLRLSDDLHKALSKLARSKVHTLYAQILFMLRQNLDNNRNASS